MVGLQVEEWEIRFDNAQEQWKREQENLEDAVQAAQDTIEQLESKVFNDELNEERITGLEETLRLKVVPRRSRVHCH